MKRTAEHNKAYKNPDNDPRGPWRSGDVRNALYRPNLIYEIISPSGKKISPPSENGWRWSKETMAEKIRTGEIIFNKDETGIIRKIYLDTVDGRAPESIWFGEDVGTTREATTEMKDIFGGKTPFDTPKPTRLIERILQIASQKDSIILDSFAGSGTTAHAVLNMNKRDDGNRKFILIEMMDYAESITAERVKRVIKGYGSDKDKVEGSGGTFSYYELGEPLLVNGLLNEKVDVSNIREYIWFTETHSKLLNKITTDNEYFLGKNNEVGYWFYYKKNEETCLNYEFLSTMKTKAEQYIIYADVCRLPDSFLKEHNIIFKKIPREIQKF